MPLITCPDCARQISDAARACPNCGWPNPTFVETALGAPASDEVVEGLSIGAAALPGFLHPALNIAGAAFLGLVNRALGTRRDQRVTRFLTQLSEDLERQRARLDALPAKGKEEFEEFAEDIFRRVGDAQKQEQLDALRAIFLNTILSDRPRYDEASEIAAKVARWQPRHFVLLRILDDPVRADKDMGTPVGEGGGITTSLASILKRLLPEWDAEQIERTWRDLGSDEVSGSASLNAMMTDRGIHQLENRISPFGRKVTAYIRNPA